MRTALITGGARGIGLGIAKALLAEKFHLALCGTKDVEHVIGVLDELRAGVDTSRKIVYYRCNIADTNDRDLLLRSVKNDFGALHVLVNNAGVAAKVRDDLLTMKEENYEWLMRINLQGPFFLTQAVAAWMVEQRQTVGKNHSGCIVNVSSISATVASVSRGEYCMSKAAVSMATNLWAIRLAEFGIPVYEIRPGLIHTDMTSAVTDKYDKLIAGGLVPQQRWGESEDVGRAVAMLARGDLPYSTGQVLMIDGGMTIPTL